MYTAIYLHRNVLFQKGVTAGDYLALQGGQIGGIPCLARRLLQDVELGQRLGDGEGRLGSHGSRHVTVGLKQKYTSILSWNLFQKQNRADLPGPPRLRNTPCPTTQAACRPPPPKTKKTKEEEEEKM